VADLEVLAQVAKDDEKHLPMLLKAHKSSLAKAIETARGQSIQLRRIVGEHLLTVSTVKPKVRKDVVPYFIDEMLKSPDKDNRLRGVEALASFGADAKDALLVL